MQRKISIKVLPSEATDHDNLLTIIAGHCQVPPGKISGYHFIKRSLDARGRQTWYVLTLLVFIDEPFLPVVISPPVLRDVHAATRSVVIVGAGPAGLFAALRLIESGIRPVVIERGKDVRARRRDLAAINKQGVVNAESNYCFGEGGAGTYSDGKLYTRSTKRGDVNRILNILVHFGATEKILYEAHPHIGTNKLPHIITAIRDRIRECGGEVLFEKKLMDLSLANNRIREVITSDGDRIPAEAVILATGHSARDIFTLLHSRSIAIEAKPFALGVRIEHPQSLIDSIQYHCPSRGVHLPPASYSLVQQVEGRGVFSFCMCPGGIIAPAATNPDEIVVNGWSPSKRDNPFANSGIVVSIEEENLKAYAHHGPLSAMYFQQEVERRAFTAGGGHLVAPAQRMVDFTNGKVSSAVPPCSYLPGIRSVDLKEVLPSFVHLSLQKAFREFGSRMKGYLTNDAVIVATESRTSSPVRIPRAEALHHPQISNLYPCGEGAGYAGGIVSAAMDGERVAGAIAQQ